MLEEWNASVSAFVENDGGDENSNCYCPSIDEALEEEENNSSRSNRQSNTNTNSHNININEEPTSRRDEAADEESDEEWYDSDWQRSFLSAGRTLSRMLRCTFLPDCEPTLGSYSVPIERGIGRNSNADGEHDDNDNNDNDNNDNDNDDNESFATCYNRDYLSAFVNSGSGSASAQQCCFSVRGGSSVASGPAPAGPVVSEWKTHVLTGNPCPRTEGSHRHLVASPGHHPAFLQHPKPSKG